MHSCNGSSIHDNSYIAQGIGSVDVGREDDQMEVRALAEKILVFLHEQEERRGQGSVPIASLYKAFESEATYDSVQQATKYLVERDLIAPFAYSLTAKGRREHSLKKNASGI